MKMAAIHMRHAARTVDKSKPPSFIALEFRTSYSAMNTLCRTNGVAAIWKPLQPIAQHWRPIIWLAVSKTRLYREKEEKKTVSWTWKFSSLDDNMVSQAALHQLPISKVTNPSSRNPTTRGGMTVSNVSAQAKARFWRAPQRYTPFNFLMINRGRRSGLETSALWLCR